MAVSRHADDTPKPMQAQDRRSSSEALRVAKQLTPKPAATDEPITRQPMANDKPITPQPLAIDRRLAQQPALNDPPIKQQPTKSRTQVAPLATVSGMLKPEENCGQDVMQTVVVTTQAAVRYPNTSFLSSFEHVKLVEKNGILRGEIGKYQGYL